MTARRAAAAAALALGALFTAARCAPSLRLGVRDALVFGSTQRCSQGPFEFRARALGARWGESFALNARAARRVRGYYVVLVDGVERARGSFGSRDLRAPPPAADAGASASATPDASAPRAPDNAYCLGSTETSTGPSPNGAATGGVVPGGDATVFVPVGPGGSATSTSETTSVALRPLGEIADDFTSSDDIAIGSVHFDGTLELFERGAPPVRAGAEVRFRIWSDQPNDLEGVQFALVHRVAVPSVPEAEYVAHLRRERAAREGDSARRVREASESARREADRRAFCAAHRDDTGCWGAGGYAGYLARQRQSDAEYARRTEEEARRRRERAAYCEAHHDDEGCWGPGGYEGMRARQREYAEAERRREEQAQRDRPPPGPPPPARAEARPPTPSANAEWIPGYWHWDGLAFAWGWIGGHWRVPDEDRRAGLTARAPTAPPAPQPETRTPPPDRNAVWTPGYWQWDGRAFVWVAGSWQLPPAPGQQWRPSSWRVQGVEVVFDPGAWLAP